MIFQRKIDATVIQEIFETHRKGHSTPKHGLKGTSAKVRLGCLHLEQISYLAFKQNVEKENIQRELSQLKKLVFEQTEKIKALELQKLHYRLQNLESLKLEEYIKKLDSCNYQEQNKNVDSLNHEERLRKLEIFVLSGATRCPVCHSSLLNQAGATNLSPKSKLAERRIVLSPTKAMASPLLAYDPGFGLPELIPVPISDATEFNPVNSNASFNIFSTPSRVLSSIAHPIQTICSISSTIWSAFIRKT